MIRKLNLLFFVGLILVFIQVSCNSSKSYYKKGDQLKQAGLEEEAAEYFLLAAQKNVNNIDARIALKTEGQKLLETKLEKFYKLYTAEDYTGATKKYIEAEDYIKLLRPYVKLEMAPYYAEYFEESKKVFLEDQYKKASDLIDENKFESANIYLKEILEIDPAYKDVASLKNYSDVEPLYIDAVGIFEAGRYREAYKLFSRVIKMSSNYKEASYYKAESLKLGRLTIAVLDIESEDKLDGMANALNRLILQSGSAKKNPFLVYIDRESTQAVLNEQKLGLSGLLDEKTVAETGKLLGAKVLIRGKILDYNHTTTGLTKRTEKAFHETISRQYSKEKGYYYNQRVYKKTTYQVYSMKRTVECRIELTMISSETGEVVLSYSYPFNETHNLEYAVYGKDSKNLYPGYYKSVNYDAPEDKINKNLVDKQKLDRMLSEKKRELRGEEDLKIEIARKVAQNWAWKVRKYEKGLE